MTFSLTSWLRRTFSLNGQGYIPVGDPSLTRVTSAEAALQLSAVWRCVQLISESIAALPCCVYTMDANGDKIPAKSDPLYRILGKSPNADMNSFEFWQAIIAARALWGNAYCLKTYTGAGQSKRLVSLEMLRPDRITLRLNNDGSITYIYDDAVLGREEYDEDQILHFKGFSLNGRLGMSVISYAGYSFGNVAAMEETSGKIYARGMNKTGVLQVDGTLTKEQREAFKENVATQFSNVYNGKSSGTMVLEGGMKFEALSLTPEDAELISSRSFGIEEICRWFGVNPVLIGHSDKTTTWGSGIEQLNLQFVTYTLSAIVKSIEMEIQRALVPAGQQDTLMVEFDLSGFLRADTAGRASFYSSAVQNGWMTRAEVRQRESLPVIEGSDVLTAQSNLAPLDKLGTTVAAQTRQTDPGYAATGAAADTAQ